MFFKVAENEDGEDNPSRLPRLIARTSIVFNVEQVEGWQDELPLAPLGSAEELPHVETFVQATRAEIRHGGTVACFDRRMDRVRLPERAWFFATPTSTATEAYYSTLLQELIHWTGAEKRLNRRFGERFGDDAYAAEELVAELGAAFLCAELGVSNAPRQDHAAYISTWLSILREDARAIFTAANAASAATQYLHEGKIRCT